MRKNTIKFKDLIHSWKNFSTITSKVLGQILMLGLQCYTSISCRSQHNENGWPVPFFSAFPENSCNFRAPILWGRVEWLARLTAVQETYLVVGSISPQEEIGKKKLIWLELTGPCSLKWVPGKTRGESEVSWLDIDCIIHPVLVGL